MRLGETVATYLEPRDSRPIREYAHDKIELFPPITKTGYFSVEQSRHFIAILDSLDDERVREVNILKPVRGGGSLLGDIHLSSVLPKDRHSGPYMNVFQTDADAKMHFHDRIKRMMEGNPVLACLLPNKYDWSEIQLNNGHTLYTGGPTIANLQSKGVMHLRLDECWIYPPGRMAEAEARVGDYLREHRSKILRISQAGPQPGVEMQQCDWLRAIKRSSVYEWEVQCTHCQLYFQPLFSGQKEDGSFWGITFDKHLLPNGDWNIAKTVPTTRFECPHCHGIALDGNHTKYEWNRTGRYTLTTEENIKRKTFHWESVIDFPWDELVELWLDACNAERRGVLGPKIQFYQKRRAIFKDEESLLKGGLHLTRLTYEIKKKSDWPEEVARFLTIDRQQEDMFWWMIRAWSRDKSRRLGFGKAYGFAALEQIRINYEVAPNHTFCDSAYQPKGDHGVYAACLAYKWVAVRGAPDWGFPHRMGKGKAFRTVMKSYAPLTWGDPGAGTTEDGRRYCPLIIFSKPQMNQLVQQLIESGHWEEPLTKDDDENEKEYNAQMAARIRRTEFNKKTGETKVYWWESQNDHMRDCANMQCQAAVASNLVRDPVMEQLSKGEKIAFGEEESKPTEQEN